MNCSACASTLSDPAIVIDRPQSLTSLCSLIEGPCRTYICAQCGHAQTPPIDNAKAFYSVDYEILIGSDEEDQIYQHDKDGNTIYRLDHQAATSLKVLDLPPGARVLEYGAAKGASLRRMREARPDLDIYFFDVSDMYVDFWSKDVDERHYATFVMPDRWDSLFDAVVSYFVLEHVIDLEIAASEIRDALLPGGKWQIVVPNPIANSGDLVVVDHAQHFTPTSIVTWLERMGFVVELVSDDLHDKALVVVASKPPVGKSTSSVDASLEEVNRAISQLQRHANYWNEFVLKIDSIQAEISGPTVIYGASFYGSLVYSLLGDTSQIVGFVDRNPHLQGSTRFDLPVYDPNSLPDQVTTVVAGVQPERSREILATVNEWQDKTLTYIYP